MKNALQEAEALFAGLGKPTPKPEADPGAPPAPGSDEDPGKRRRRIVAGATVTPQPLPSTDGGTPRQEIQARMSQAIRSLGGHDDSVRVARRRVVPADPRSPSPVRRKTFAPKPESAPGSVEETTDEAPMVASSSVVTAETSVASPPPRSSRRKAVVESTKAVVESAGEGRPESYVVRVSAPSVADEDLCFYFDGTDVAGVAGRAREQVGTWMAERHADAAWDMRSIERVPSVLR